MSAGKTATPPRAIVRSNAVASVMRGVGERRASSRWVRGRGGMRGDSGAHSARNAPRVPRPGRTRPQRRRPTSTLDAREVRHDLDLREPRLAHQRRHRRRLPGADLERDRPRLRRARRRQQAADDVEPVRTRRAAPAPARSARSPARAPRRPPRRAGSRRSRRAARRRPRAGRRGGTRRPARAAAAFARATSSASALASVATTSRSGRSDLSASAIAPEPVPDVADARALRQVEHAPRRGARSPGAGSARAGRRPARSSGSPSCRGCRRPARARAGAPRTP